MDYEIWKQEKKEEIVEIVETLSKNLNAMQRDEVEVGKEIAENINRKHRTIQQKIISSLVNTIVEYSKNEHCDARNESSVALAKKITSFLESEKILFNGVVRQPYI